VFKPRLQGGEKRKGRKGRAPRGKKKREGRYKIHLSPRQNRKGKLPERETRQKKKNKWEKQMHCLPLLGKRMEISTDRTDDAKSRKKKKKEGKNSGCMTDSGGEKGGKEIDVSDQWM